MDEKQRADDLHRPVEDLDTPQSEAEEVKGGFSWGVSQTGIKSELSGIKGELSGFKRGQGLDGLERQHNETLIRI